MKVNLYATTQTFSVEFDGKQYEVQKIENVPTGYTDWMAIDENGNSVNQYDGPLYYKLIEAVINDQRSK